MKIIIFTGLSASGKSSIAQRVTNDLSIPQINLHLILHDEAEKRGFSRIRDWMDVEGSFNQVLRASQKPMLDKINDARNPTAVIVDQVIDPETLNFLKSNLTTDSFYTIFVKSNRHDRKHWALKRDNEDGLKDMRLKDHLKQEAGVRSVIEQANLIIVNSAPIDELSRKIIEYIKTSNPLEGGLNHLERNS